MKGPYFKSQQAAECGCYYPDVTRIGDDVQRSLRILYCIKHGFRVVKIESNAAQGDICRVPTIRWRDKERKRLTEQCKRR